MAHVIDRWHAINSETGRKKRTDRYGKGLRWQVEYVNGDGAKRRRSFAYRELADVFCTEVKAEQHRGVYRRGTGRETFQDVAEQWLDAQIHLRDTSRDAARIRLEKTVYPSLGSRPITLIAQADIQAAVASWALDYAPSTVRLAYGYMSSVFHYAVARELIPRTPCVKIRLPRETTDKVVPLSDETVAAVAAAAPAHLEAMVWLIAATGLRGGEARALTWDRVHPVAGSDELGSAAEAAADYREELLAAARHEHAEGELPRFDLALLSLGPDTHVASLFPGREDVLRSDSTVFEVLDSPKPPPTRVTLSMPAINSAERVWLLVSGAAKADALAAVRQEGVSAVQAPGSAARGVAETLWLVTEDALPGVPDDPHPSGS